MPDPGVLQAETMTPNTTQTSVTLLPLPNADPAAYQGSRGKQ